MNCQQCGKNIPSPRPTQKFCRGKCRYDWHRARRTSGPSWETSLAAMCERQDLADAAISRLTAAVAKLTTPAGEPI